MAAPTGKLKFAYETIANMDSKIQAIELLNKEMHVAVSGYLKGSDWEHWQEFNESKFKINR